MSVYEGVSRNFGGMVSKGIAGAVLTGMLVLLNRDAVETAAEPYKAVLSNFFGFAAQQAPKIEAPKPIARTASNPSGLRNYEDVKFDAI